MQSATFMDNCMSSILASFEAKSWCQVCYDRALKSIWRNKIWNSLFNDIPISLLTILTPCITLYDYSCLHFLHYTWHGYIRSYTKDPSHEFLTNRWPIHSWFIGLGNPLEVVVHHLLIGGMVDLNYQDLFPMVSALECMVTHRIGPTVSHDLKLSSSHDLPKLLHYVVCQSWEKYWVYAKIASGFDLWMRS